MVLSRAPGCGVVVGVFEGGLIDNSGTLGVADVVVVLWGRIQDVQQAYLVFFFFFVALTSFSFSHCILLSCTIYTFYYIVFVLSLLIPKSHS